MREIRLLVIHHSASSLQTTAKQIMGWHAARFKLGIGYHRIIEADGGILDGRKVQRIGAHAKRSNTHSIGICVVGDNTQTGREWTEHQERSLDITIRYYVKLYPDILVLGHRDTPGAATLCPGLDIAEWCKTRKIKARTLII